ncbi:MAG TPA: IPT/TIG domain-containing protein [Nitrospiraceae bacterium]
MNRRERMMRHSPVVFSLVLSAFVSVSVGCRSAETPAPEPQSHMAFTRDIYNGKACVEYSWVSEHKRRLIQLSPHTKEGEGEGPKANDASRVQVHALTNGQYSLKDWQFPAGPPHSSPVVGAIIELKEIEAAGTVFYQDHSSATHTTALVPMPVQCPSKPEVASIVDPEIMKLDPRTVEHHAPVTITVLGSNFTRDSLVLIDGADPTTQYVSPSTLEAELDADDTAAPGKRGVKVHGAKNGTTSNEVLLTVQ